MEPRVPRTRGVGAALGLALLLPPGAALQDPGAVPPSPFDEVHVLELTADDPPLLDGRGPVVVVELEVGFSGTLHLWTRSELELALRVEDADDGRVLAEDDDSAGESEPCVQLRVEEGLHLAVLVAAAGEDELGPVELVVRAAPESAATLAAARVAAEGLAEGRRMSSAGDAAATRELAAGLIEELLGTPGAEFSEAVSAQAWELGYLAQDSADLASAQRAWSATYRYCRRALPADHLLRIRAGFTLGSVQGERGELAAARPLIESTVAAYELRLPPDHPELLSARTALAITLAKSREPAAAQALFESILAARERTLPPEDPQVLRTRSNLAAAMADQGDFAGARPLLESVAASWERLLPPDDSQVLSTKHELAITLQELGDLEGERVLKESVLAARERTLPADHPALRLARHSLSVTLFKEGDLAGARALQEEVLASFERTLPPEHPERLSALENLSGTLQAQGDLAGARSIQEEVLAARERTLPEGHRDLLVSRMNLAATLAMLDEHERARVLLESALAACEHERSSDHPDLLFCRASLAGTLRASGDLAGARALFETVVPAYERTLPPDHPDLLRTRGNLALTLRQEGDLAAVRALVPVQIAGMRARLLGSLALAPRQAREAVAAEAHRLAELLFLTRDAAPGLRGAVFELTETMRMVAGEAARALRGSEDPEIRALLGQAAEVRAALGDLVLGAPEEGALQARITALTQERDRLERAASRRQAERGVVTDAIGLAPLARALGDGTALIAYRRIARWSLDETTREVEVGHDHLFAHVVAGDGTPTRIDLGEAEELERLVLGWREAMGAPAFGRGVAVSVAGDENRERETGEALRARLVDPLLAELDGTVRRLLVCADDLVFLVPLDALPFEDGRLGDRWRVSSEVSCARLLSERRSEPGPPSLLLVGGVDYGAGAEVPRSLAGGAEPDQRSGTAGFPPLAGTRAEADALSQRFQEAFDADAVLLAGSSATEEAFAAAAAGRRWVHVATHGWFAPEAVKSTLDEVPSERGWVRTSLAERVSGMAPMLLSGLALAGANRPRDSLGRAPGILTAEELASLTLSSCDLAVLSACETNVGIRRAGQGIQSLQAALYAAGAKSSVTSLWKVDDAATRRLMELFYTKLWVEHAPKVQALWEAKKVLREEGAPVRDWAGWVLTGDPE